MTTIGYNSRMRMRRKANLEDRMNNLDRHLLVREPSGFYELSETDKYNIMDLASVFENSDYPLWLEIGCGKGQFAFKSAEVNKCVNFIAVEKMSNVIVEPCERAKLLNPTNLTFMNCAAENLLYYLPEHSVDRILLNFSCPYPKYTYRNRRLTYFRYLELYKKLLKDHGEIYLKTDNRHFFEFSIQSLSESGYKLRNLSLDLHSDNPANNITTEYEDMFVAQGKPIFFLIAYL